MRRWVLVLSLEVECVRDEGEALMTYRPPLALVEIRDVNARGVTDSVDERECCGAFRWGSREGVADPGVGDDERGAIMS